MQTDILVLLVFFSIFTPFKPESCLLHVKRGNAAHGLRLVQHDLGTIQRKHKVFVHDLRSIYWSSVIFLHVVCPQSRPAPTGMLISAPTLTTSTIEPAPRRNCPEAVVSRKHNAPSRDLLEKRVTFRYLSEYQPGLGQACCYFLSISIWGKFIIKKMTPKGI